nr:MAG TPA: hypothetical protein [Caudoviricetes sp.]
MIGPPILFCPSLPPPGPGRCNRPSLGWRVRNSGAMQSPCSHWSPLLGRAL